MPPEPALVEVIRGDRVESTHRVDVAVVDDAGRLVLGRGTTDRPVYPRSAAKGLQALPLVASGAAAAFAFGDRALALACASHNAEAEHVAEVTAMLAAIGCSVDDLACGATPPYRQEDALAFAAAGGTPTAIHNCCSGKHAGFLALARRLGSPTAGYEHADHPVQHAVKEAVEAACAVRLDRPAVDGCSAPTWAVPLDRLALGFARFGTGTGLEPAHADAAARLRGAVAAAPSFVAGTGRFDTEVMTVTGADAFVKYGAEGVFTVALPRLALGAAVKADDGAARAAEVVTGAVLAHLLPGLDLERFARQTVRSRRGEHVGEVRGHL